MQRRQWNDQTSIRTVDVYENSPCQQIVYNHTLIANKGNLANKTRALS